SQDKPHTAVTEVMVMQGDDVLFRTDSFTEPFVWLRYNPTSSKERIESTPFFGSAPVSFSDVEVVRETVKSRDGTKIPLKIIRKKGTHLDANNPTILTGYGGFGRNLIADFDVSHRLWLDQGGILAVANLRGGAEFGQDWHTAGSLANKTN